ncbi:MULTISPECIES: hypothetical protein [Burkholderia]|uniref:hypothetical protein n=1 Tax=Burkholderia TaxID=32008 RepID=UPI0013710B64|nr:MULTISPECIES: hypothetical protein [Burkholderia]
MSLNKNDTGGIVFPIASGSAAIDSNLMMIPAVSLSGGPGVRESGLDRKRIS